MQYTLEELELEALSLSGLSMEKIRKVDELRLKAPLFVYPPQKAKFDVEYNEAMLEKEAAIKEEQENKHNIGNIMYWLDELDAWINGMDEMVNLSGK